MEEALRTQTPRETFRRAKIDHYLQRAEEYVLMGRFHTARKALQTICSLDPANEMCKTLQVAVDEAMHRIRHRGNGERHSAVPKSDSPPRRSRGELVLVVDQDERILTSLNVSLRRYGFETVCAASYDEAVETLEDILPDVIVSEVNFETGPRGFDLYSYVKTKGGFAGIPFIFLAARIDRDTLIAGKRFGVDDFIQKPADTDVITASIANSLTRRKQMPS